MNRIHIGRKRRHLLDIKLSASIAAIIIGLGTAGSALAAGMACSELKGLKLPQAEITSAEIVKTGEFKLPENFRSRGPAPDPNAIPEFCRVAATLKPSEDSNIKMELWLPTTTWNGDYHTVANSGWAGSIATKGLIDAIQRGYAAASTDTGHTEEGGSWAPGHPEKVKDYGGRAIHETTVKAKAITEAFYGRGPAVSYMIGCSLGGLQVMKSIQAYPEDFDAVVAGSPHFNMTWHNANQIWPAWLLAKDSEKFIPEEKIKFVHEKVLAMCDGVDGLKDGIVDNPETCGFKPASLLCKGEETFQCLTAKQVQFLEQVYAGPVNQRTGESVNPGPALGNEGNFRFQLPPKASSIATELFKSLVFEDSGWDWMTMDYATDMELTKTKVAPVINAENPDLRPYFNRGGKLLMYIGSYETTNYAAHLAYLNRVRDIVGAETADKSIRLFVVPGMGHCGGGIGCDTFDKFDAIERWQETGVAPDVLDASHVEDGKVTFARPLCAYPKWARYNGSGDSTKAENFSCK